MVVWFAAIAVVRLTDICIAVKEIVAPIKNLHPRAAVAAPNFHNDPVYIYHRGRIFILIIDEIESSISATINGNSIWCPQINN